MKEIKSKSLCGDEGPSLEKLERMRLAAYKEGRTADVEEIEGLIRLEHRKADALRNGPVIPVPGAIALAVGVLVWTLWITGR